MSVTPPLRARVLDHVRCAYPDAVDTDEIRNRFGDKASDTLGRLAREGDVERVRQGWYRAKAPAQEARP